MQFQYVSRFPRYVAAASRHCNKRTDSAFWSGRFEPRPSVGRRLVGVGVGLKGGGGSEEKSCSINGRRAQVLPGRMQFTGAQSAQKAHNESQDLTNNRSPPTRLCGRRRRQRWQRRRRGREPASCPSSHRPASAPRYKFLVGGGRGLPERVSRTAAHASIRGICSILTSPDCSFSFHHLLSPWV